MRRHFAHFTASFRSKAASLLAGFAAGFLVGRIFYRDPPAPPTEAWKQAMLRQSQNNADALKREQESRQHADTKTP